MSDAKTKREVKADDFIDYFKGFSDLAKENYNVGLKATLSLWEENQKFANAQLDHFFSIQKEYADQLKAGLQKLPNEVSALWGNNYLNGNLDRVTSAQRDYVDSVRKFSDKFTKDALNVSQKTAEKTLSVFEEYASLFKS